MNIVQGAIVDNDVNMRKNVVEQMVENFALQESISVGLNRCLGLRISFSVSLSLSLAPKILCTI